MVEASQAVYRVDKFIVPASARDEFMARVMMIKSLLQAMPGCRQNLVLERTAGPGAFNVVTFVEWQDVETLAAAKVNVAARYKEMNFDPQEFISRLGVTADIANYGACV